MDVYQVVLFSASHFLLAKYEHLNMAAKVALIILFLSVKSKSWVLEKKFANVSNIFQHILYYNISQLFLERLITQKIKPNIFARFLDNIVLILSYFSSWTTFVYCKSISEKFKSDCPKISSIARPQSKYKIPSFLVWC
jgi:hypothetical protein